jgi:hypothetical protein
MLRPPEQIQVQHGGFFQMADRRTCPVIVMTNLSWGSSRDCPSLDREMAGNPPGTVDVLTQMQIRLW